MVESVKDLWFHNQSKLPSAKWNLPKTIISVLQIFTDLVSYKIKEFRRANVWRICSAKTLL
jgi:hypothetical protein